MSWLLRKKKKEDNDLDLDFNFETRDKTRPLYPTYTITRSEGLYSKHKKDYEDDDCERCEEDVLW